MERLAGEVVGGEERAREIADAMVQVRGHVQKARAQVEAAVEERAQLLGELLKVQEELAEVRRVVERAAIKFGCLRPV